MIVNNPKELVEQSKKESEQIQKAVETLVHSEWYKKLCEEDNKIDVSKRCDQTVDVFDDKARK